MMKKHLRQSALATELPADRRPAAHWALDALVPIPARRSDVWEVELNGEAVLYDSADRRTFLFNETMLALWRGCDGHTTAELLAERLTKSFEVDHVTALDHVDQAIVLLTESNLLAG